jgi:hypothetical protein
LTPLCTDAPLRLVAWSSRTQTLVKPTPAAGAGVSASASASASVTASTPRRWWPSSPTVARSDARATGGIGVTRSTVRRPIGDRCLARRRRCLVWPVAVVVEVSAGSLFGVALDVAGGPIAKQEVEHEDGQPRADKHGAALQCRVCSAPRDGDGDAGNAERRRESVSHCGRGGEHRLDDPALAWGEPSVGTPKLAPQKGAARRRRAARAATEAAARIAGSPGERRAGKRLVPRPPRPWRPSFPSDRLALDDLGDRAGDDLARAIAQCVASPAFAPAPRGRTTTLQAPSRTSVWLTLPSSTVRIVP